MNNSQQTARVGMFFLLGLALIWVTFETLSGGKVFKDKGYPIIAGFETLKSLKPGDEVRMAGVRIGEVTDTRLADKRAEAVLRIDSNIHIKSDAIAEIAMQGLIGTNTISIDLGSPNASDLAAGAEIKTRESADLNKVMSQIGDLGKKLDGALGSLTQSLAGDPQHPGLMQKIDRLVTENHDNVTATVQNLREVSDKINKGQGTVGKLINSSQLHDELLATVGEIRVAAGQAKTFVANAQAIVDQVKSGKGVVGTLVYDEKAAADLKASIANVRLVSDKMAKGEGTLGKFLSDDSMYRDAQAIMKKADRALDGLDDTGPITAVGVVAKGLF